jgi:hypothetical protein
LARSEPDFDASNKYEECSTQIARNVRVKASISKEFKKISQDIPDFYFPPMGRLSGFWERDEKKRPLIKRVRFIENIGSFKQYRVR